MFARSKLPVGLRQASLQFVLIRRWQERGELSVMPWPQTHGKNAGLWLNRTKTSSKLPCAASNVTWEHRKSMCRSFQIYHRIFIRRAMRENFVFTQPKRTFQSFAMRSKSIVRALFVYFACSFYGNFPWRERKATKLEKPLPCETERWQCCSIANGSSAHAALLAARLKVNHFDQQPHPLHVTCPLHPRMHFDWMTWWVKQFRVSYRRVCAASHAWLHGPPWEKQGLALMP